MARIIGFSGADAPSSRMKLPDLSTPERQRAFRERCQLVAKLLRAKREPARADRVWTTDEGRAA